MTVSDQKEISGEDRRTYRSNANNCAVVSHFPRQNVGIRVIGSIITMALSMLQWENNTVTFYGHGDGPLLIFEFDDARELNCHVLCVCVAFVFVLDTTSWY